MLGHYVLSLEACGDYTGSGSQARHNLGLAFTGHGGEGQEALTAFA